MENGAAHGGALAVRHLELPVDSPRPGHELGQLGTGLTYETGRWNVTLHAKGGVFINDARVKKTLRFINPPAATDNDFTRIDGAQEETEITHNWYYKGVLKASVVLPVRAGAWRTWSSKTLLPEWTGEWMVEILSQDGSPLDSIIFILK